MNYQIPIARSKNEKAIIRSGIVQWLKTEDRPRSKRGRKRCHNYEHIVGCPAGEARDRLGIKSHTFRLMTKKPAAKFVTEGGHWLQAYRIENLMAVDYGDLVPKGNPEDIKWA